jgi:hypothetical protein
MKIVRSQILPLLLILLGLVATGFNFATHSADINAPKAVLWLLDLWPMTLVGIGLAMLARRS